MCCRAKIVYIYFWRDSKENVQNMPVKMIKKRVFLGKINVLLPRSSRMHITFCV